MTAQVPAQSSDHRDPASGEEAAWQRVPVTEEMVAAFYRCARTPEGTPAGLFRAMLRAAPKSPGLPTEDEIAALIIQAAQGIHDELHTKMYERSADELLTYYAGFNIKKLANRSARAVLSLINRTGE